MIVQADQHTPYEDERVLRLIRRVMADRLQRGKPFDYVVDLGDRFDFEGLSVKFLRSPQGGLYLRREFHTVADQITKENEALGPHVKRVYIKGNHEERLTNYIWGQAPGLADLLDEEDGVLTIPALLRHYGADTSNMTYVQPYTETWEYSWRGAKFVFTHGDRFGITAARMELRDRVVNGMSGHVHRDSGDKLPTYDSLYGWWTCGCLCNIEGKNVPPGRKKGAGKRYWVQGFATVEFSDERPLFSVTLHTVHRGKAVVYGKVYVDRGGRS